ncbi:MULTISPECIES: glutaminyl-peptide cyclotransferase [unclassified Crossiella]|uniref:glutaminyl-peptide cyclotransferase n=1 Tax=unclassified Crossiella TaxID=2620835 RepID=UPI001FFEC4B2|nr:MULTISPECIES: glutaminyl-peptide cyclotransferase [unclassified Crossiella]MCK2240919.1 glutaminyl-peptide cyclotransferase [Crossiella sp. S99.2]MCK2253937.1 glutaminyl-peptide cyclotransferase [Crossiella sp. S99.1]
MTTSPSRTRYRPRLVLSLLALLLLAVGCTSAQPPHTSSIRPTATAAPNRTSTTVNNQIEQLEPEILQEYPHDRQAHTQGVEMLNGVMLESTGLVGQSSLRAVEMTTGRVLRQISVQEPLYAMGIATVPGVGIWQLTWKDGVAILRNPDSFAEIRRVRFAGQGWGACYDGTRLITSDGMDRLIFRNPNTFERTGEAHITRSDGRSIGELNELECVDGAVWANEWHRDHLLRINPATGKVTGMADLKRVRLIERPVGAEDVLNGIAAIPGTNEFLVTGKHFGQTYHVRWKTKES